MYKEVSRGGGDTYSGAVALRETLLSPNSLAAELYGAFLSYFVTGRIYHSSIRCRMF
jgi:hypothetical protein